VLGEQHLRSVSGVCLSATRTHHVTVLRCQPI
jgi:hypothetical protein